MAVLLPVAYHVMVFPLNAETLEVQSGKMRGMSQQTGHSHSRPRKQCDPEIFSLP